MYRIFDLALSSELPLDGLLDAMTGAADLTVVMETAGDASGARWEWIYEWKNPQGAVTLCCARHGADYLLRAPGVAEFRIDFGASRIAVVPLAGAGAGTLAQLLVDQVIPRFLFHRGRLVMHASAVTLDEAVSVAFLGCSGRGKSTLAASFQQQGAALLTDDCLLLEARDEGVVGIPAYPALRLWPDSAASLYADQRRPAATTLATGKVRVAAAADRPVTASPPFSALFILGDPCSAPPDGVLIAPLSGQQAMMAMIESAFVLDVVSREAVRANFLRVSRLVQRGLPVYSLNYPRRYEWLPAVRRAVAEAVTACQR